MPACASICLENADYRLIKKKYLQSDWLRGVQIGQIEYNITLLSIFVPLTKQKKIQHSNSVAEK